MTTAFAIVLGLLVGSFLNVCIHRLPLGQSVVRPRSHCPACGNPIAWHDNIPLCSFLWLRGRCRNCSQPISVRYPLVEVLNAAAYGLIVMRFGAGPESWKTALFASMMLILFFTDLVHFILPNQVTRGGLVAGIAFSSFVPMRQGLADLVYSLLGAYPGERLISLTESLLGAALFGVVLLMIGELFYRIRGIEGLGRGDVKLVAMIAAFQGTSVTLLVLLGGSLLATVVGTLAILAKRTDWYTPLPFGSYLSATALGSVFAADVILNRYWEYVLG